MFDSREPGAVERSSLPRRSFCAFTWLTAAVVGTLALSCSDPTDPSISSEADSAWPPQEDYDILPVRRAVAALALAGIEMDADSVRVERVTSQQAVDSDMPTRFKNWTDEQRRLQSMLRQGMGDRSPDRFDADVPISVDLAAYYDMHSGTVFVVADEEPVEPDQFGEEAALFVAMHELVHQWRDDRSDLLGRFAAPSGPSEDWFVTKLLIEGEAHFAATHLLVERGGSALLPKEQWSLEDALHHGLAYESSHLPYSAGATWSHERFRAGGWPAVWRAFDDPPASSEQLLHPEKRRDAPQLPLASSDFQGEARFTELASDRLGELGFLELFERMRTIPVSARIAAAGWDGDLVSLIELPGGEEVLFARSIWDRESDAEHVMNVIGEETTGAARRSGCIIDWTSGDESLLTSEAFAIWARRTDHWRPHPADADSTERAEARIVAEERALAYQRLVDDRLCFPAVGVMIDHADDWTPMPMLRGWGIFKRFEEAGALLVLTVTEPPLPDGTPDDQRKRLQQRIAVHSSGRSMTRTFDVRHSDGIDAVTAAWQSVEGSEHRAIALPTVGGVLILLLEATPSLDVDIDAEWDALLDLVKTGVIDDREWDEDYKLFYEELPDLEFPIYVDDR